MGEELASERAPGAAAEQAPDGADALASPVYCIGCGYDLRGRAGGAEDRCPECGIGLDFVTAGPKPIPWEHRRGIGAWRAYWATVILMIRVLLPGGAHKQLDAPATYAAAQKFRWITVVIALLGVAAAIFVWPGMFPVRFLTATFGASGSWIAVFLVASWLVLGTGIPSYGFEDSSLGPEARSRAIAMSYYCSAPLVLVGPSAIGAGMFLDWGRLPAMPALLFLIALSGATLIAGVLSFGALLVRLAWRVYRWRRGALAAAVVSTGGLLVAAFSVPVVLVIVFTMLAIMALSLP